MSGSNPTPHPNLTPGVARPRDGDPDEQDPNIEPIPQSRNPPPSAQDTNPQSPRPEESNLNDSRPTVPNPTAAAPKPPSVSSPPSTSTGRGRGRPRKIPKPSDILDVVLGTTERPCKLPKPIADTLAQLYAHPYTNRLFADPSGRQMGPWNDFTRLLHGTFIRSLSGESQDLSKEPALLRRGVIPAALLLYYQVAGQEPPPYESKNDRTTQAYKEVINVNLKPDSRAWGIPVVPPPRGDPPIFLCRTYLPLEETRLVSSPRLGGLAQGSASSAASRNDVSPGDDAEMSSEYAEPSRKRRREDSGGASSKPPENGCRSYHPASSQRSPVPQAAPSQNTYNKWMDLEAQKGTVMFTRASIFQKQVSVPKAGLVEKRSDREGSWQDESSVEAREASVARREALLLHRVSEFEDREAQISKTEDSQKRSQALQVERQIRQDERHALQEKRDDEQRRCQALQAERQIRQDERDMLQEKREADLKARQYRQDEIRARQNAREDGQDARSRHLENWEADLRRFHDDVVRKAHDTEETRRRILNLEENLGRLEHDQQKARRERGYATEAMADIQRREEDLRRWEAELAQSEDAYRARNAELLRRERFNQEWSARLRGQADDLAQQRARQVTDPPH